MRAVHGNSLTRLGEELGRQVSLLIDRPWDRVAELQATQVTAAYCFKIRTLFGIDLEPVVTWYEQDNRVELDAIPKTDFDEIMWKRLLAREAAGPQPEQEMIEL